MFGLLGHIDTNAGNDQMGFNLSAYENNKDLTTPDLNSAAQILRFIFFMTAAIQEKK